MPIFLIGAFILSSRMEDNLPNYSVINNTKGGYSVFFQGLKELKYPVERTLKPVGSIETQSIQIIADYGQFDINSPEIMQWIKKGGKIIYLTSRNLENTEYKLASKEEKGTAQYTYFKGKVVTFNPSYFTNKTLTKNTSDAYKLVKELDKSTYKRIYFNEYFIYLPNEGKSLWGSIPFAMKIIVYQLVLAIMALYYYKGKRFGKPIPLYEETERTENEYLYNTASIYSRADCWDIITENYYTGLLKEIKANHETWLEKWENEGLPMLKEAKKVYEFMNRMDKNKKCNGRECLQIINIIEELNNAIAKRRDSYWKTWKTIK